MQMALRGRQTLIGRVETPHQRSKLFEWLFAHHDEMVAASAGRRVEWRRLCVGFAEDGLTDGAGNPPNARTARMTWWRVRKEKVRVDALRAAERAERERRAAANPRRDMPSQFRKGDCGPPLVTMSAAKPERSATTVEQAKRGFQLSTADGCCHESGASHQTRGRRRKLRLRRGRNDRRDHEPGGCSAQQTATQSHRPPPD